MAANEARPTLAPKSDAFVSVLPSVEDVLECVYKLSEGSDTSIEEVVTKAKDIQAQLTSMKAAATNLPGGHISIGEIQELVSIFDQQAQHRRELLQRFAQISTPTADRIAAADTPIAPE